jgi:hypothetical protein
MSADQFLQFARAVKVPHPTRGVINLEIHSYLERLGRAFFEQRYIIGTKFRQGAFTTFTGVYALYVALTNPKKRIMFLTKTDREAIDLNHRIRFIMENLPIPPATVRKNDHTIEFPNGSVIFCYTPEPARGKTLDLLVIDEAAFINKMEQHWKAIFPCICSNPESQAIVLSTTNGMGNWFCDVYMDAQAKKNKFYVVDAQRGFRQEVLCEFLSSTKNVSSKQAMLNFFESLTPEQTQKLLDQFRSVINATT